MTRLVLATNDLPAGLDKRLPPYDSRYRPDMRALEHGRTTQAGPAAGASSDSGVALLSVLLLLGGRGVFSPACCAVVVMAPGSQTGCKSNNDDQHHRRWLTGAAAPSHIARVQAQQLSKQLWDVNRRRTQADGPSIPNRPPYRAWFTNESSEPPPKSVSHLKRDLPRLRYRSVKLVACLPAWQTCNCNGCSLPRARSTKD